MFSKKRQLVLTDRPRLFYIDPDSMDLKGEIPWTMEYPVRCSVVSCLDNTLFSFLINICRKIPKNLMSCVPKRVVVIICLILKLVLKFGLI